MGGVRTGRILRRDGVWKTLTQVEDGWGARFEEHDSSMAAGLN